MSYFRVGANNEPSKKPFVEFSSRHDRANLMSTGVSEVRRRRRGPRRQRSKSEQGRRRQTRGGRRVTKVKIVKGKVSLRVGGFPGVQRVGASQLVQFVPLDKLRAAAKRVLGASKQHRRVKSQTGRKRGAGRRKQSILR